MGMVCKPVLYKVGGSILWPQGKRFCLLPLQGLSVWCVSVPISLWPVLIKSAFPSHNLSTGAETRIYHAVLPDFPLLTFPLLWCVLEGVGSTVGEECCSCREEHPQCWQHQPLHSCSLHEDLGGVGSRLRCADCCTGSTGCTGLAALSSWAVIPSYKRERKKPKMCTGLSAQRSACDVNVVFLL